MRFICLLLVVLTLHSASEVECGPGVDLFLDSVETNKLMGVSAQLYLIRNGLVNEFAVKYPIPVPRSMDQIAFVWQQNSGRDLQYSLSLELTTPDAADVLAANFNVSRIGVIPTGDQASYFAVDFKCSGHKTAEVEVLIGIKIHFNRIQNNITEVVLRRIKACVKSFSATIAPSMIPPPESSNWNGMTVLGIGLATAVGLIFAILLLLTVCSRAASGRSQLNFASLSHTYNENQSKSNGTVVPSIQGKPVTEAVSEAMAPLMEREPVNLHRRRIAELTVQRCRIRLSKLLKEGTYGKVYRGTYDDAQDVLVKTVGQQASPLQVSLLLQEGMALYGAKHDSILTVLGVSIEDHISPYLLYAAPNNTRNLKTFLHDSSARGLITIQIVRMSMQIAEALEHLHRHGVIHKDVAARNCVIDDQLRLKLADNSLARDLFPGDYCCLGDSDNRPIKWMALEAIQMGVFTEQTDSWAFGVLMWELCTLARHPYAEIDAFEMETYLVDGFRLQQPTNCPDELFSIMAYCWSLSPLERPKFDALCGCIQEFYAQISKYV